MMPYVRKANKKTPAYSKRKNYNKRRNFNKTVATIAKKAVMRVAETKHVFNNYGAIPDNLYHNTPAKLGDPAKPNLLVTRQGTQDGSGVGAYTARIGDKVNPVGVKIFLTFKQPYDRPNVLYKFLIQKTRGDTNPVTLPFEDITGVKVIDSIDPEKSDGQIVFSRSFTDRSMNWSRHDSTLNHNKELTFVKTFWVDLRKYKNYAYSGNNETGGRDFNLIPWLIAYDSFGTLTTDIIASYRFAYKFYFKDM